MSSSRWIPLVACTAVVGCASDFSYSVDTAPGPLNGYTGTEHHITEFRDQLPTGIDALINDCALPFSLNVKTTGWDMLGSCTAREGAAALLSGVTFESASDRKAKLDVYENLLEQNSTEVELKNVFPEELRRQIQHYIHQTIDFGVPPDLAFCELSVTVTKPAATPTLFGYDDSPSLPR